MSNVVYSNIMETFVGAILLFNFYFIILDTDFRSAGEAVPLWLVLTADICLFIYLFGSIIRVCVEQQKVFYSVWI